jgi:PhzF family phenazine biosynthesis protein
LRWFTPTLEVELCGHATLATSFVLASQGYAGPFRYHTRSGLLTATMQDGLIELDFPARANHAVETPQGMAAALGVAPRGVFKSADLVAVLESPDQVVALRPDLAAIARLPGGAVIVTAQGGEGADITSRYFAPGYGIDEDPVTGALHTQVVPYWVEKLGRDRLICHQASARGGIMTCTLKGDRVRMAGRAVLYARGEIMVW